MPMTNNALITKIAQNPLLLQAGCEELFTQSLMAMQSDARYTDAMATNDDKALADDFWDDDDDWISWLRPYDSKDGLLTIPVHGVLLNRVSIKFANWMTGYGYIRKAFERGMEDPEVHTIVFDIDSPGGEVAGNFALVEQITAGRDSKNIVAFANDGAYSAAYSIASAASEIVISRSGGVGSVGVLTAHVDMSKAMEQRGVKVTFIYAGKHKVDGNPYEALPAAVKDRIQTRIDRTYGEFVGLVAANRGMDEDAVRATEALMYDATDSIEVGFADRIGTMEDEVARLTGGAHTEEPTMANAKPATTPAVAGATFTQEQMDAAVAAATTSGMTAGATAEQTRVTDVMACDEAKERPVAARALADAGLNVDTAKVALAGLPVEAAATPTAPAAAAPVEGTPEGTATPAPAAAAAPTPTPFAANMSGTDVGANVSEPKEQAAVTSDDLLGAYAAETGRDLRVVN